MSFKKEQAVTDYLLDTHVENLFIAEHMAGAPGDYVKVYLFALMYAELEKEVDNAAVARLLSMEEEDVLKAWTYWDKMGVVKKHYINKGDKLRYNVEFLCQKEKLYGSKTKKEKQTTGLSENKSVIMEGKGVQKMYAAIEKELGRPLSGTEIVEIVSWIEDQGAAPETVVAAYAYCKRNRKKDHSRYVGAVVREWVDKNLLTEEAIADHLEQVDKRYFEYKRILKALGFTRNATEEEKRLMNGWFDEMNLSLDKVLSACARTSGISNPNMNYVNKILEEWNKEEKGGGGQGAKKGVTAAVVFKYYDYLREKEEREAEERRQEVYGKIPRVREVEDDLHKIGMDISRAMIAGGSDKEKRLSGLKKKIDVLNEEKAFLLTENNFRIDYMDVRYLCPLCKDMGTDQDGGRCSCFPMRLSEAEEWQIS